MSSRSVAASWTWPRYASATSRLARMDAGSPSAMTLTEVEHVDVVAHVEHERDVVVDQQDARAGEADVADPVAEPLALGGVEAGRRLVEQEDLRFGRAGAGDRHELALALAEVTGVAVAEVGDADEVERTLHGAVLGRALDAERRGADVLLDAEVVVELERLERASEAAAHALVRPEAVDPRAVEHDVRRCLGEAGDRVDRARLAGAVGADEPDDAAGRHPQRQVVDRDHAAVLDRDVLDLEHDGCVAVRAQCGRYAVGRAPRPVRRRSASASAPVPRRRLRHAANLSASSWPPAASPSGLRMSVTITSTPLMTTKMSPLRSIHLAER